MINISKRSNTVNRIRDKMSMNISLIITGILIGLMIFVLGLIKGLIIFLRKIDFSSSEQNKRKIESCKDMVE